MKASRIKTTLQNDLPFTYLPLYLLAAAIAVLMKYFCRINDSDALIWMLAPTARWVSILSGIPFEYLPHMGYINHFHQFLIAPACSGNRFLLLTFLMLVFSFLKPDPASADSKSIRKGYLWFAFSIFFSYISTIFVNGIRITASIYLPIVLEDWGLIRGWLTSDRLHTIIGTTVYFSFLCAIYPIAAFICRRGFLRMGKEAGTLPDTCASPFLQSVIPFIIPAFWYLLMVLVIPFLGRLCRNEWDGFGQYVILILGVCLAVTTILRLLHLLFCHIS